MILLISEGCEDSRYLYQQMQVLSGEATKSTTVDNNSSSANPRLLRATAFNLLVRNWNFGEEANQRRTTGGRAGACVTHDGWVGLYSTWMRSSGLCEEDEPQRATGMPPRTRANAPKRSVPVVSARTALPRDARSGPKIQEPGLIRHLCTQYRL